MKELLEYLQSKLVKDPSLITKRRLVPFSEYDESDGELHYFGDGQTIEQVLENRNGAVILGDAGIGKTTFLNHVCELFSQRALGQIGNKDKTKYCIIPYLLSGRNLSKNINVLIERFPLNQHRESLKKVGLSFRPLFLIDGLDEISGRWTGKGLESIISFVNDSGYPFLLASRTIFFQFFRGKFFNARIDAFRIAPLTSEEVEYLCHRNGCSHDRLFRQSHYYGFSDMLHNPQTLKFMIEVYKGSILPDTKSDLLRMFIKGQLKKRNLTVSNDFYKILRDIALVMELLEKNVISVKEFEALIRARYKNIRQITNVYDKLNRSGLIVAEGSIIRFEHRSLGEFLAAERIAGEPLDQILNYSLVKKSNVIKPSWSSSLGFLIELHKELRHYCTINFQRECLEATPSVFTAVQKRRIFNNLYTSFCFSEPQFLYSTNKIKVDRLGYFGSKRAQTRLLTHVTQDNDWVKANATLMLGYIGTRKAVPALKSVALNKQNHRIVRLSALESLGMIGNADDINDIKDELANEKELKDHYAIAVARLAGDERIEDLLDVLPHLQNMISMEVIEVCRKLKTRSVMERVLDFLISHPDFMKGFELLNYVERLLGNLKRLWNASISHKLSELLLTLSKKQIWFEKDYHNLIIEAIEQNDPQRRVIQSIFYATDIDYLSLYNLDPIISKCMTPGLAILLVKICKNPSTLVHFGYEVRRRENPNAKKIIEILKPYTAGRLTGFEENEILFKKKQVQEKKKKMTQSFRLAKEFRLGQDIPKILRLLKVVSTTEWPTLNEKRKKFLSQMVENYLNGTTAVEHIEWISKESYKLKRLPYESSLLCLKIIDHYNLQLSNSTLLIDHLFYGGDHNRLIIDYFQRNGVRIQDNRRLDELFKVELQETGLRRLIRFIEELNVNTDSILNKLMKLIRDQSKDCQFRLDTLRVYVKVCKSNITVFLEEISNSPLERLSHEATKTLVSRQHVPTILRSLGKLLEDKFEIPSGTSWSFGQSEVDWFEHIQINDKNVWNALVKVMQYSIEKRKYGFLNILLLKMSRIDRRKTLSLIQSRLPSTTDPTLRTMFDHLETDLETQEFHELGKIINIEDALEVIASTKPFRKIVIYVEGPNDVILYKAIQTKFATKGTLPKDVQYFFDQKGGWNNIYAEKSNYGEWIERNRPDPIFVLVDSDYKKSKISECEEIWNRLKIPYHILKRKSPECYYPEGLLKKVFNKVPASKNEIKNQTKRIAEVMTLRDIKGTDLYEVFAQKIKKVVT